MKRIMSAGLIVFLAFGPASAQVAKLAGPSDAVALDAPVFLDVAGSEGPGGLSWKVIGPAENLPVDSLYDETGAIAYGRIRPAVPGRYLVVLVAIGQAPSSDESPPVAVAVAEVVAGEPIPDGGPGGDPPDDPMAAAVRIALRMVPDADRPAVAQAVARECRIVAHWLGKDFELESVAGAVAAGAVQGSGEVGRKYAAAMEDAANALVAGRIGKPDAARLERLAKLLEAYGP